MKLRVNGVQREVPEETTVKGLLEVLNLAAEQVAVERNGDLVRRAEHPSVTLREGDVVEVVTLVGGG